MGYYGPPPTEEQRARYEKQLIGPCLEEDESGTIQIVIPSPYPDREFIAEMRRWQFEWDGTTWRRPTTTGKELKALRWARELFVETFGYPLPPINEVAGPLAGRRPEGASAPKGQA